MVASMPKIPDPLDDELSAQEETEDASTDSESTSNMSDSETPATTPPPPRESDEQRLTAHKTPELGPPMSEWHKLPPEIRFAIYEELLVAKNPIHVHSGWRFVYKRQDLGIPTSILSTCWDIYNEAIGVLYGSNTFLYRLRDHVPRVTDVDRVAHIDDPVTELLSNTAFDDLCEAGDEDYVAEYEYHSDPDWQEEKTSTSAHQPRRSSRHKTKSTATDADINIKKHLHLFRRIIVEAEKNRSSGDTRSLMANAIKIFEHKPRAQNASSGTNIHTLKLKVAPTWENTGEGEDEGHFTFVDFFGAESSIIKAVEGVQAQFVRIDLMKCGDDGKPTQAGFSLKIDMRHLRLTNRVRYTNVDMWRGDMVMQQNRQIKASKARRALTSLDSHVADLCEKYLMKDGLNGAWHQFYLTF